MEAQLEQLLYVPEIQHCIAGARHKSTLSIVSATPQNANLFKALPWEFFPSDATCSHVPENAPTILTDSSKLLSLSQSVRVSKANLQEIECHFLSKN